MEGLEQREIKNAPQGGTGVLQEHQRREQFQ